MSRRNRILVPEARDSLNKLKGNVMVREGLSKTNDSDKVKYEVAQALHIPLRKGDNGDLTASNAGKIGGKIGGTMVKELIKMAQEQMKKD